MSLKQEAQYLAGPADIAALLHVLPDLPISWYQRQESTGYPDPLTDHMTRGPVWDYREVLRWWANWRPLKRGPKSGWADPELLEQLGLRESNGQ